MRNTSSKKLLTKLPNGKFKVNKAAIIAKLAKANKAKREVLELGVINASQREIDSEAREITRYNADSLINTSEE
jgi:hypothetical protein